MKSQKFIQHFLFNTFYSRDRSITFAFALNNNFRKKLGIKSLKNKNSWKLIFLVDVPFMSATILEHIFDCSTEHRNSIDFICNEFLFCYKNKELNWNDSPFLLEKLKLCVFQKYGPVSDSDLIWKKNLSLLTHIVYLAVCNIEKKTILNIIPICWTLLCEILFLLNNDKILRSFSCHFIYYHSVFFTKNDLDYAVNEKYLDFEFGNQNMHDSNSKKMNKKLWWKTKKITYIRCGCVV